MYDDGATIRLSIVREHPFQLSSVGKQANECQRFFLRFLLMLADSIPNASLATSSRLLIGHSNLMWFHTSRSEGSLVPNSLLAGTGFL